MTTSTNTIKNVLPLNPVIIFLVNQNSKSFSLNNSDGCSYFFQFKANDDFFRTVPIIIGQYNGVFGSLDKTMDFNNFESLHFMENGLSNQLALYLIQELSQESFDNGSPNENMIFTLGDYLVKLLCEQEHLRSCLKMGITPFQLKSICRYIENKIDEPISTKELASIAGLSIHHFIRMFKRTTGETPHQCVIRMKLDHAKELLIDTEENITQVGMCVGFDNPSHFSQLFKSNFGIPPLKFRKTYSQNSLSA
ncbi:helix-turn-helix domain-containing protein [Aquimarina sp. 2304DJ70-9]|uniref:helix-turn-helix domain-containing protein n=1 Tax=Aquimarina penaris TaxID=3231044 RepID=UPI0034637F58